MDGIHPPFQDEDLEVTLITDDSDSDADTDISALHRIIEDLYTSFETDESLFDDSATVPDDNETEDPETVLTMTAEATFVRQTDELEKKLKLLDDKNKELNEELDRVHDRIREEDRVRKEFVDVISDKFKDIATPKMLDMKKRIRVPLFKGEQGENPVTHILSTLNRLDELRISTDGDKTKYFKLTLDADARQRIDDITPPATWDDLSAQLKKRFST